MQLRVGLVVVTCGIVLADPIDPTSLLVSVSEQIREYTRAGTLVQTWNVPYPHGRPSNEHTRDLCMMDDGRIAVFNGTNDPYLSIFDPAASSWRHATFPGWSTGDNSRWGGIATHGPFVFVSDSRTFGGGSDELRGVIRFDTRDLSAIRVDTLAGTHDVTVGLDGLLYAAGTDTDPTETIRVFDPVTLVMLREVTLNPWAGLNGIAVDRAGQIYVSSGGWISEYSPSGALLRRVDTPAYSVRDIDVAPDGTIIGGTYDLTMGVLLTDVGLNSFQRFDTPPYPYVSFAFPTPEPASATGLILLALRVFRARRRSKNSASRCVRGMQRHRRSGCVNERSRNSSAA